MQNPSENGWTRTETAAGKTAGKEEKLKIFQSQLPTKGNGRPADHSFWEPLQAGRKSLVE